MRNLNQDRAKTTRAQAGDRPNDGQVVAKREARKPRKGSKRGVRGRDAAEYHRLGKLADSVDVDVRTLERDAEDGLLRLTYFRGARRVSERDWQSYLRKVRGLSTLLKRRRSPRPKRKSEKEGETQ